MKYVSNAFSPKMLNPKTNPTMEMIPSSYEEIQKEKGELISSIGHQTIADYMNMEKNRMNIQLEIGDIIYIVTENIIEENKKEYDYMKIILR